MDQFARRAVDYCTGLNRDQFAQNQLIQDAVLRNIELIGEAAARIPSDARLALMWSGMSFRWSCLC
jgi:uncharacterized protein with HEPN domain